MPLLQLSTLREQLQCCSIPAFCATELDADYAFCCRAAYRLAEYAESLYEAIESKMKSPEHETAKAIVRHKQHQVWPTSVATSGIVLDKLLFTSQISWIWCLTSLKHKSRLTD